MQNRGKGNGVEAPLDRSWPCGDAEDRIGPLAQQYPAFRFWREQIPGHGLRWIVTRVNGLEPGLHTVITAELAELQAALRADEERHAR
jgi:hypothetical protein